jgi:hypothetical protein
MLWKNLWTMLVLVAVLTAGPALVLAAPVSHGPSLRAPHDGARPPLDDLTWLLAPLAFGGVIRLRDMGSMSKKFVQRAGAAQGDYTAGVSNAGQAWQAGVSTAGDTYRTAVTQAASEGRYEKGVAEAGPGKYQERAKTLGAQRYPAGVAASEGEWARGFGPYASALNGMDLPARGPRGSAQNNAISQAVAMRLHAIRVGK